MRGGGWRITVAWLLAATVVGGCGGKRIEGGVFYSPKGYRITIPGPEWLVADESRADLELRSRKAPVGMLVNAACDPTASKRPLDVLTRNLFLGLRDRRVVEQGEVSLNGRPAEHSLVEVSADAKQNQTPMRVEAYVMKNDGCVYDLLYVAPSDSFAAGRRDFERFVSTLELPKAPK